MLFLVAGLVIFIGVHCLPMRVEVRARLVEKVGLIPYKAGFSLVSALGLGLIIWGKVNADFIEVWQPIDWLRIATIMLMFPALLLIVSADGPDNSIRRILGHPMILGVELWAIAHLLANGDLASIILFGSFLVWALVAFASASRRKPPKGGTAKRLNNVIVLCITAAVYAGILYGHEWFTGYAIF